MPVVLVELCEGWRPRCHWRGDPGRPPGGCCLYLVRGKRRRCPWPELAGSWRLEGPWVRPRLGGGHWPLQPGGERSIHCPNLLDRSEHLQVNITSLSLSLAFVALVKIIQSFTLQSNHAAPDTDRVLQSLHCLLFKSAEWCYQTFRFS